MGGVTVIMHNAKSVTIVIPKALSINLYQLIELPVVIIDLFLLE